MNYRTERLPVVTFSLIGLNTLVWLVSLMFYFRTDGDSELWIYQHWWLAPASAAWYAWFTSMFVHAGFFHLAGNMLFLFLFGCCVEDLIGPWRFLCFYLLGGFAAELVYIAVLPQNFASTIPMGGASGAISACMGMYLALRAEAEIEFKYFYFSFFFGAGSGEFSTPVWMTVGFWFLKDLLLMIWELFHPSRHGGTAFGAHVGGLLAGLALIGLFRLTARKKNGQSSASAILSPQEIKAAAPAHRPAPDAFEIPTIYLHSNGVQSGPFTLSQIQWRLAQNELDARARYWSEGMSQWESIQDLADRPLA